MRTSEIKFKVVTQRKKTQEVCNVGQTEYAHLGFSEASEYQSPQMTKGKKQLGKCYCMQLIG